MVTLNVPVQRITAEARQVRFGRTVATLLAAVLYGVGWVACKFFTALWFCLAWCGTAVKVGWVESRNGSGG